MSVDSFPIRVGARSQVLLRLLWGVRPGHAYAEISDGPEGRLDARFGRVRFSTPLANVAHWQIEGPFQWIKAIGIRRSLRDADVSFAGAAHGGVRMDFRDPVRWSIFKVPAFYVGADDLEGFAAALQRRGIPGVDARRTRP
jgi:hypothetical protein